MLLLQQIRNRNRNYLGNNLTTVSICYHPDPQEELANRKQDAERIYLRPGRTQLTGMRPATERPWPRGPEGSRGLSGLQWVCTHTKHASTFLTWACSSVCQQLFRDNSAEGRTGGWPRGFAIRFGFGDFLWGALAIKCEDNLLRMPQLPV